MARRPLIPLPDFGLVAHFWDTWKALRGFYGIAVIALIVFLFNTGVTWYITSARERRTVAAQKKAK